MGRENKKEAIASLHRKQIMEAAEELFSQKGYTQTTIDDISKKSKYSRRTIYVYYKNKDDILHHIIEQGLIDLKQDIENAIKQNDDFIACYQAICIAMKQYQSQYPHSMNYINSVQSQQIDHTNLSDTVKHIFLLGTQINTLLADFIEEGKVRGIVREDVVSMLTVYVLWSSITSLLSLQQTKGQLISQQFAMSENEFLDYGFKQIINSILKVRIENKARR